MIKIQARMWLKIGFYWIHFVFSRFNKWSRDSFFVLKKGAYHLSGAPVPCGADMCGFYFSSTALTLGLPNPFLSPNWVNHNRQKLHAGYSERNVLADSGIRTIALLISFLLNTKRSLQILDFGGGSGEAVPRYLSKISKHQLKCVEYYIFDQPEVMSVGSSFFEKSEYAVRFLDRLPVDRSVAFDLVISASTLQYILDWKSAILSLTRLGAPFVVFTRFISNETMNQTYYSVQTIETEIGSCGSVPVVIVGRSDMVQFMREQGYQLVFDCFDRDLSYHFEQNVRSEYKNISERTLLFNKG